MASRGTRSRHLMQQPARGTCVSRGLSRRTAAGSRWQRRLLAGVQEPTSRCRAARRRPAGSAAPPQALAHTLARWPGPPRAPAARCRAGGNQAAAAARRGARRAPAAAVGARVRVGVSKLVGRRLPGAEQKVTTQQRRLAGRLGGHQQQLLRVKCESFARCEAAAARASCSRGPSPVTTSLSQAFHQQQLASKNQQPVRTHLYM